MNAGTGGIGWKYRPARLTNLKRASVTLRLFALLQATREGKKRKSRGRLVFIRRRVSLGCFGAAESRGLGNPPEFGAITHQGSGCWESTL